MSDHDLRTLERVVAVRPDDDVALQALEAARIRAGLGWHGEQLPDGLSVGRERHVYGWRIAAGGVDVEMVYVPAHEEACDQFPGGPHRVEGPHGPTTCFKCKGTSIVKRRAIYTGRFPVTLGEFRAYAAQLADWSSRRMEWMQSVNMDAFRQHPVVNVSHVDALGFCEWAGLRLPREAEWKYAALGPPIACTNCKGPAGSEGCIECGRTGKRLRRYPWSKDDDTVRENGPSMERCIWAGAFAPGPHFDTAPQPGMIYRMDPVGTRPVLERPHVPGVIDSGTNEWRVAREGEVPLGFGAFGPLVPARPLGASWCGAHDMFGNVWELTQDGRVAGGSFRIHHLHNRIEPGQATPADDVGFRVALSAAP